MNELTLKIITPGGSLPPVSCDSIRLTVCDNGRGQGGGSYGIRAGHTQALFSLDRGEVRALLSGKTVLSGTSDCGFASVSQNTVILVTENFTETHPR